VAQDRHHIVAALLKLHGTRFSSELGIDLERNLPGELFRWLVACILFSARISSEKAKAAARALFERGWTTPEKMAGTTREDRVRVLNRAGYARYEESTARMLGETCAMVTYRYGGDLRRLRDAAARDPAKERRLLAEFKGLGETGADIFFREAQLAWEEIHPFADRRAVEAAALLALPTDAPGLAALVAREQLPDLLAALVRTELADDYDAVRKEAAGIVNPGREGRTR
jgi:hypothetical protein